MGYTTYFSGKINIHPPVSEELKNYINLLSETRRMKRDVSKLIELYGTEFGYNGSYGTDGEFFARDDGQNGQSKDDSIVSYNNPPSTQHGLWMDWIITEDGSAIQWNDSEKFYSSAEWMEYLINTFMIPNGHVCNGKIKAQGEEPDDKWKLIVKNNSVTVCD